MSKSNDIIKKLYQNDFCNCYEECKKGYDCKNPLRFYKTRVGKCYDEAKIKILIVGQEDVKPKDGSSKKYDWIEPCTLENAGYNYHYLRTFYTVSLLLDDEKDFPKSYNKEDMIGKDYLRHSFAQTNYYKCVFSDTISRTDKKHLAIMEKNCSQLLLKEIKILKPDLVIIQGKNHKSFWKNKYSKVDEPHIVKINSKMYEQGLYKMNIGDKETYILDSYHPTSHRIWTSKEIQKSLAELLEKVKGCVE